MSARLTLKLLENRNRNLGIEKEGEFMWQERVIWKEMFILAVFWEVTSSRMSTGISVLSFFSPDFGTQVGKIRPFR